MIKLIENTPQKLIFVSQAGYLGLNYRKLGYISIFLGAVLGTLAGGLPFYYVKHQASSQQIFLFFVTLFIFLTICITGALYVLDPLGADTEYVFDNTQRLLTIIEKRWYGASSQSFSYQDIAFWEIIPRPINPEIGDLYLYFDEKTRYWLAFGKIDNLKTILNLMQKAVET
ncbi:MAG: hypothetical protein NZ551_08335 [Microscillaceae bacterium]|nr:hypothetical protein [Microscillaceae bacterium]MDW8461206.1 hypothetical protein [Cytophagales bacterium]